MTRQEFRDLCNKRGHNNPSAIEDALFELLESLPGNVIIIPRSEYFDPEVDEDENSCLIEHLTGGESIEVINSDDNDSEAYIASIHLSVSNPRKIVVTVYCYYESEFREVYLSSLTDSRDAMRFALEYGKFDDAEPEKPAANRLSERQKNLLDEFLAAAERLNEAGVSLFWNDDDNGLAVINRDAVRDGEFFSFDDAKVAADPESESVYENLSSRLEIEVSYISKDIDILFYPKND